MSERKARLNRNKLSGKSTTSIPIRVTSVCPKCRLVHYGVLNCKQIKAEHAKEKRALELYLRSVIAKVRQPKVLPTPPAELVQEYTLND